MFLLSCAKFYKNDANEYVSNMNSEEINKLNKQIIIDEKIAEFLPKNLKSDEELSDYLINSDEAFDELHLKGFKLLDITAEFKEDKDNIHKIDNSNPLSVGKGALNLGKTLAKGVWSGGKLLISSGALFDYKTDYYKFKKTYNNTKLDSLRYVMNSVAIINLFEDEFNLKQTELIQKGKSVWSINLLPEDIKSKVNFEETLTLYKKLKLESNQVVKILVFNKMNGLDCSEQLNIQAEDLKSFWNSGQEVYKNDFALFENYFESLSDLKSNILQIKIDLEKSKNDFNNRILSDLNEQLEIYNDEIIQNIVDLNVYQKIPSTEIKLKNRIREGSEIYFE
jgi:hypothetical protein